MPDEVRRHLVIRGLVQGVYFRESMRQEAERLALCGWVRNLPDGSVEAEVQGPALLVARMVDWAKKGPAAAKVESMDVRGLSPTAGESGFAVRR